MERTELNVEKRTLFLENMAGSTATYDGSDAEYKGDKPIDVDAKWCAGGIWEYAWGKSLLGAKVFPEELIVRHPDPSSLQLSPTAVAYFSPYYLYVQRR